MKLYPFDECLRAVVRHHLEKGATFYQQFNCAKCGAKQTVDVPNLFFTHGDCQECGGRTDIQKDGCNYMLTFGIG